MSPSEPASTAGLGRIKGAAFREFVAWYERVRGGHVVAQSVSRVDPEYANRWLAPEREALGILPSQWYPAEFVHQVVDALIAHLDEEEQLRLAAQAADAVMSTTLKGVYKAVFSLLASPERYPKYVQKIWDMHYDSGIVAIQPVAEGEHYTTFREWKSHHPFICKMNIASGHPIYSAMGCLSVRYEALTCVMKGDEFCSSTVFFER